MRIYHLKGTQFAIPTWFKIWYKPEIIKWRFVFDERAWYDHSDPQGEQKDWLKLTGVSYYVDAMKESAMCSWRANTITDKFEFGAYFHVDGNRIISEPLFTLPKSGGEFDVIQGIDYDSKTYSVDILSDDDHGFYIQKFKHNKTWARSINSYAGGTLPMPNTISFDKKLLKVK